MIKGCLIGQDVRSSYSQKIHEAIGTPYDLVSLKKEEIKDFLLNNDYDFINVTIPYKEEVIKYLDKVSREVKEIGACNLIRKEKDGLVGYNTDYLGFLDSLDYHGIKYHGIEYQNKKVLILGTGGASKAVYYAFKSHNIVCDIVSRNKEGYLKYNMVRVNDYDIIINATPWGMYPHIDDELLLEPKGNQAVIDLIYNPLRTKLLQNAMDKGIKAVYGIAMLVFQALHVYDNIDKKVAEAFINLLEEEHNIVIIGMPYAGKSELGKKLASIYPKRDLYDIDDLIVSRYGKISDIFENNGEDYFRNLEEEVIKEISLKHNAIIIPGGGFFKHQKNIDML
ncbi:MAG: hypothetical protein J5666_00980, partial [Bacilli bacterium]|nr:hypothetical protein [Bacilli bacterium]